MECKSHVLGALIMEEKKIEVNAECYSEKTDLYVGFGAEISETSIRDGRIEDTSWIDIGIGDSYWENYFEFEPKIAKAKQMAEMGRFKTFREALFDTFGHFNLRFEVNGVKTDLRYNYDVDGEMYEMLEETI